MAKSTLHSVLLVVIAVLLVVLGPWFGSASMEEDEKDCADQLLNLAACIPYVSGNAKKPTAECCADAEEVRSSKPKCLCVLVIESTDPSLALPVNTTLALQMPAACNSDAKVSNCPRILKLSPGSPEAKIFQDAGGDSSKAPTPAASSSSSAPIGGGSASASKVAPSDGGGRVESYVGVNVVILMISTALMILV